MAVWRCGGVAGSRCGGVTVWRCGGHDARVAAWLPIDPAGDLGSSQRTEAEMCEAGGSVSDLTSFLYPRWCPVGRDRRGHWTPRYKETAARVTAM